MNVKKLSVIGASGDVGREFFSSLLKMDTSFDSICLFYHSDSGLLKLTGMCHDILCGSKIEDVKITNAVEDLISSDVCVICAGSAITTNPSLNNSNINNRESVFEQNKDIVMGWIGHINKLCPQSLIVLVTNPVSRLISIIHDTYANLSVIGCGITNDTLRVRNEFLRKFKSGCTADFFVIGEHDVENQAIAYISEKTPGNLFEIQFENECQKHNYISNLKKAQNNTLANGNIPIIDEELPIMYKSYMRHRLGHFLNKTHLSTAVALIEILSAYIFEDRIVSVELEDSLLGCVIGEPIKFRNKEIIKIPFTCHNFEEIKSKCQIKYPSHNN